MSETTPGSSVNDFLARQAAFEARAAALHADNKSALFAVLKDCGVTTITVTFDGAGDSGQIERIDARRDDASVALPDTLVSLLQTSFHSDAVNRVSEPLPDAVEQLVYDFLSETHCGWENNAGAFGEVAFDVGDGSIHLEFNERFEDVEYFEHTY